VESFLREVNLPTIVHGVREALGMAGARRFAVRSWSGGVFLRFSLAVDCIKYPAQIC